MKQKNKINFETIIDGMYPATALQLLAYMIGSLLVLTLPTVIAAFIKICIG